MRNVTLFLFLVLGFCLSSANSWDITSIYEAKDAPRNCKAIDNFGNPITTYGNSLTTIDKLLIPCSIDDGKYQVTIIEISTGFYKIKDTDFYIEMKGTNYFGPTSIISKSAEVILIKNVLTFRIEY